MKVAQVAKTAAEAAMPLAEAASGLLQLVANDDRLNGLYDAHRGRGYEKIITFPLLVEMVGDTLLQNGNSGYRAFSRARESGELEASLVAAYGKLARLKIPLSQAFLCECTDPLREIFPHQAYRSSPRSLQDFATVILDGKAIKNVAKRMKPLRGVAGGLLGGRTLVALEYKTGLALAMHAEADGDANDARFVPQLLPVVRQHVKGCRLWLVDRGFCDLNRLSDFTQENDHFLVRYHKKNSFERDASRSLLREKDDHGRHYQEEWGWLGAKTHKKRRYVRRITLIRPDADDLILITDLDSPHKFPAKELLAHYRERWGIERVFQQVTETFNLQGLIGGTPEATIFQFSFCLMLYNVLQTIRAFVAQHQQLECENISVENLFRDTRDELITWTVLLRRGVLTQDLGPSPTIDELRQRLSELLQDEWSNLWFKARNKNPRRPAARATKRTHTSVYRLLNPNPQRC